MIIRKATPADLPALREVFAAAKAIMRADGNPTQWAGPYPDDAAVLRDIADEERVHAGEFLRLLEVLDPAEAKYYDRGFHEVDEMIADEEEHKHR